MTIEWLNSLSIVMLLIGFWHVTKSIKLLHKMIKAVELGMEVHTTFLGKHILKNQAALKEHKENDH